MTTRKPARAPRSRTEPGTIASTLWAAGPAPIEVAESWPPRVLTRALLEYSAPGDRVVLMPSTPDTERLVGDLDRILAPTLDYTPLADTDLIVATTLPGAQSPDPWTVAEVAASRLRAGGLLVVFTRAHRDPDGTFHDPSGELVSEAQNTDLLYLQHLIAAPIRDTEIVPTEAPAEPGTAEIPAEPGDTGSAEVVDTDRVHLDVLVFLQPHDLSAAA